MKDNELDDLFVGDDELEDEDFATSINDFDDDSFDDELKNNNDIATNQSTSDELEDDFDDTDFDYEDDADFSNLEDYDDLNLGNFVIDDIIDADDSIDDDIEEDTQIRNINKLRKIDNMKKEDSKYTLEDNVESIITKTKSVIETVRQFLISLNDENKTTDENLNAVNKLLAGDIPGLGNKVLSGIGKLYETSVKYFFEAPNQSFSKEKTQYLSNTLWFVTAPLKELFSNLSAFTDDEKKNSKIIEIYNNYVASFKLFMKTLGEESNILGLGNGLNYSICEHLNCYGEAEALSKYLKTILDETIIKRDKDKEDSAKINKESARVAKMLIPNPITVHQAGDSEKPYSIVDSVIVYQDKSTKIKCKCSNLFRVDYPLLAICILPVNVNNNNLELLELSTYAPCPVCGRKNILSITARKMLMSAITKTFNKEKVDIRDIKKAKGKETTFNVIKYAPSTELFLEYAPAYYMTEADMLAIYDKEDGESIDLSTMHTKKDEDKTKDEVISSTSQFLELISKPLKKYRDWVNYYRDSIDVSKNVQEITDFNDYIKSVPLSSYLSLYSPRYDTEGLTYKLYSSNGKYVIKKFSKLICGILGRNYIDYKKDAINTLIEYLNNTPIVHDLNLERLWITEAISSSPESVKHMKDLDVTSKFRSAQTLFRIHGPKGLDLGTELNPDDYNLNKYLDDVYNDILEMKSEYKKMIDTRHKLLNDLKENTRVYSMIPLVRNTEVPKKHLDYLKIDNELTEFVDLTTDLMLLNSNIDNLVRYMEACAPRKDKASLIKKSTLTNILKSIGDISRTDIIKKHLDLLYNLGLLNSDNKGNFTGIPERLNIALNLFTVVHFPPDTQGYDDFGGSPINNLLTLVELQEALKRNNEFEIMNLVNKLDWLDTDLVYYRNDSGSKVLSDSIYDTPTYHTIYKAISNLREVAKEFVDKYGSSPKDNLVYNLEGIFSKEEIEAEYSYVMDGIKLDRLLNRLDNESLGDYLDRLSKVDKEDPYEVFLRADYKNEIDKNIVALEVCNIPMETAQSTNNAYKYFTFAELFILSAQTDLSLIANMFMIDDEIVGKLSTSEDYEYGTIDKKEYRLKILLEYCIYLNAEYNIGNYFTDLPQVEGSDLEDSPDKEIDILTKLDFYKADESSLEAFQNSGKYIDKDVYKDINDYIND